MTKVLLSVHVLAAIVLIGPMTVATSLFPRVARAVLDHEPQEDLLHALHGVSRVYAVLGLAVPVFGLATAARMRVLGQAWLTVAIVLTAAAVALLFAALLPAQQRLLALTASSRPCPERGEAARLLRRTSWAAGGFALLWATVTVLMVVRPGSTTGA